MPVPESDEPAIRSDTATREQWLRAKLIQLSDGASSALQAESYQGYAAISRQETAIRAELDTLMDAKGEFDPAKMPEDEMLRHLATHARQMPEAHLRVFVEAYCDRHNLPQLTAAQTH